MTDMENKKRFRPTVAEYRQLTGRLRESESTLERLREDNKRLTLEIEECKRALARLIDENNDLQVENQRLQDRGFWQRVLNK